MNELKIDNFLKLLDIRQTDFPLESQKIIHLEDFRFREIEGAEKDKIILHILQRLDKKDFWISGADKQHIWEKGWEENLKTFRTTKNISSLIPKFVQREPVLRLDSKFIKPFSNSFEFNFVNVYRHWLFSEFFKNVRKIYEFGCGSCQHIPVLVNLYPDKEIHGLDWAASSLELIRCLKNEMGWNIIGHRFNLFQPDATLDLDADCGVFTMGTMEQLGKDFVPFTSFLLEKRPSIVVNVETIHELYNPEILTDYLAIRFDESRSYLKGYLSYLKELEKDKKITILKIQRVNFGSMFHDSYSLIAWTPR